jgi:hypothetical protein
VFTGLTGMYCIIGTNRTNCKKNTTICERDAYNLEHRIEFHTLVNVPDVNIRERRLQTQIGARASKAEQSVQGLKHGL